jgi:hypothetical protein
MKKITFIRCTVCNEIFPIDIKEVMELCCNPMCPDCYREVKWAIYQDEDYD